MIDAVLICAMPELRITAFSTAHGSPRLPDHSQHAAMIYEELPEVNPINPYSAIPQPSGQTCSKCCGSLEMPALRAEEEVRDERFWPEGGKNQGIGHTTAPACDGWRTGV